MNITSGDIPEKPRSGYAKSVVIGALVALVALSWPFSYLIITRQMRDMDSKQAMILKEKSDKSDCVRKRDSLAMEVKRLSIYESLSRSMAFRDDATALLRHKVGDVAYAKRDSARIIISDIVIGGSKYEYYVRYVVVRADNTMEEVAPELIY